MKTKHSYSLRKVDNKLSNLFKIIKKANRKDDVNDINEKDV